ncbi:MAG: ABC transporter ATP-binding protein [Acidobacteriota bacterium]
MTQTASGEHQGLRVRGACRRFGVFVAADHVDLRVRPGAVHCLLGPSGSGKSTLLRLIAGLESLEQGSITIDGRVVADAERALHRPPEDRAVGFVFQDYALFPHLDVRHNVAFGLRRGSRRDRHRAADRWLERVGMSSHATAMPHTLSGGQQQRVALARALAPEPRIMLLDEPFSGLDDHLRAAVRKTTLEILRTTGVATLLVTHDPREALLAGDVVSVIRDGHIIQTGLPSEVFDHSATRSVAEVFGPVNAVEATVLGGHVETPWGRFAAPDQRDGTEVEVHIRPSAIELAPTDSATSPDGGLRGRILRARIEGALARLVVALDGTASSDPSTHLKCYDLARRSWREGDTVQVTIPPSAAQVRPRPSTRGDE